MKPKTIASVTFDSIMCYKCIPEKYRVDIHYTDGTKKYELLSKQEIEKQYGGLTSTHQLHTNSKFFFFGKVRDDGKAGPLDGELDMEEENYEKQPFCYSPTLGSKV